MNGCSTHNLRCKGHTLGALHTTPINLGHPHMAPLDMHFTFCTPCLLYRFTIFIIYQCLLYLVIFFSSRHSKDILFSTWLSHLLILASSVSTNQSLFGEKTQIYWFHVRNTTMLLQLHLCHLYMSNRTPIKLKSPNMGEEHNEKVRIYACFNMFTWIF